MDFDDYQARAESTAIYPERYKAIGAMYALLGIVSEAGEIVDIFLKGYRSVNQIKKHGPICSVISTLESIRAMSATADKLKKAIRDSDFIEALRDDSNNNYSEKIPVDIDSISHELGDTLWYMSELSTQLMIPLSEIAKLNITKLNSRKARNQLQGSGDNR